METPEQQQFISAWEKKRAQGKPRFILRQMLWYAIIFAVLGVLLDLFDTDLMTALKHRVFSWRPLIYISFGALLGWFNWWLMERQYRKLKSAE